MAVAALKQGQLVIETNGKAGQEGCSSFLGSEQLSVLCLPPEEPQAPLEQSRFHPSNVNSHLVRFIPMLLETRTVQEMAACSVSASDSS